jgi:hypothetical protein
VVGTAGVVVLTRPRAKSAGGPAVIHPFAHTSTTIATSLRTAVLARAAGTPFVLAGARFDVSVGGRAPWTAFAATASAGRGNRWELVAVEVENLTRKSFDPRVLHYRLIAAAGETMYFPALQYGTGPDVARPANPLALGGIAEVELGFAVPSAASGLELAFDPTGMHRRVVVALG